MEYTGVVIEESLDDSSALSGLTIVDTKVKDVTERERTPWVKHWTMHTVRVPERRADVVAKRISLALDAAHPWYADFVNDRLHYFIFRHKVFKVDRHQPQALLPVKQYGSTIGLPDFQLDFTP